MGSATFCDYLSSLVQFWPGNILPCHILPGVTFCLGNAKAGFLPTNVQFHSGTGCKLV